MFLAITLSESTLAAVSILAFRGGRWKSRTYEEQSIQPLNVIFAAHI